MNDNTRDALINFILRVAQTKPESLEEAAERLIKALKSDETILD